MDENCSDMSCSYCLLDLLTLGVCTERVNVYNWFVSVSVCYYVFCNRAREIATLRGSLLHWPDFKNYCIQNVRPENKVNKPICKIQLTYVPRPPSTCLRIVKAWENS